MSNDTSGFGLAIQVQASTTFPAGFTVTQFADDADPFDLPDQTIAEVATGLNGDLVTWSTPNAIMCMLNIIPGTDDDRNLGILYEANRVARGKDSARDTITMTAIYPDGRTLTLSQGVITVGNPGNSVASTGRQKSKKYNFAFENKTESI